ncbi:2-C-methyl-D-erythritol 4-phosphate cytidylyltransferase [Buchnera aphidicola (Muscaphis stroyani)]|uniref:2-C-methyl-D-erythritol 4-phosphate cytidylyltransferase n=1 Tax=Buchnera aphidicola (Muscaphis stroyani) TaxID=1241869 RepID=A0A4D6YFB1_9GAMM|nr:2-C-methyl-D-erythritol 4-phosphate cytidylyltransferase [Buchnera aphidicola]QCI24468.1 2-C-methyl-D-erythritol 4-phosphate cytidylyltransferase [Buchnera aphidicola (Muscaphis stroyani)]
MKSASFLKPKIIAIVPAAGIGKRMLSNVPKQYIKIKNQTILEYTLTTLLSNPNIINVIVSLNRNDNYFFNLSISSNVRIISVIGGKERINSVLSGLSLQIDADWVIVHDAVRPCLSRQDLNKIILITRRSKVGGILVQPIHDTIKYGDVKKERILKTVDRKNLWHALTPQIFPLNLLRFCLNKVIKDKIVITDESSALEYCGYRPLMVLGSSQNIKITCFEDLFFAEFYLTKSNRIK